MLSRGSGFSYWTVRRKEFDFCSLMGLIPDKMTEGLKQWQALPFVCDMG